MTTHAWSVRGTCRTTLVMGSDRVVNQRQAIEVDFRAAQVSDREPADRAHDEIFVFRGEKAASLLRNSDFRAAWIDLADACPWATAWQSHGYAEAWLSVYDDAYEPLLIA